MKSLVAREYIEEHLWVFTEDEHSLLARMASVLLEHGYKKVRADELYLYAPGSVPVLLVAHGDTVHAEPPAGDDIFYDERRGVLWSPEGLGADDRAGVLGILEILRRGLRPHVLITLGEESGCRGASAFVRDVKDTGVVYVVELDRKNSGEAVFYDCANEKFKEYVLGYGFTEAVGTYTDISVLCPAWSVAGVNLSCGYYYAHTHSEHLVLSSLWETVEKLERMLRELPPRMKRFKYVASKEKVKWISKRMLYGLYDEYDDYPYYYPRTGYGYGGCAGERRYDLPTIGRYVGKCVTNANNSSIRDMFTVKVDVDLALLAAEYGGTEESWEGELDMVYYDLACAAEEAIYDKIHQLVSRGEVSCIGELASGER